MINYPIIGGIYKHYKGGLYEVITMAQYTEDDNSAVVVYKSLLFGSIYVRPLDSWNEIINNIKRFTLNSEDVITKDNYEKIAEEFTDNCLELVNGLLSDDYRNGFQEGIEKYLKSKL